MAGTLMAGIVAKPEHAAVLRRRLGDGAEIVLFSEADSLHVVDALVAHPPKILAVDAAFAVTGRGAALIADVKAAPALAGIELRVLLTDENQIPLLVEHPLTSPMTALLQTSRPLERVGTRRAVRYPMERRLVMVNGEHGQLVDLSVSGAQVVAMSRLQPGQSIRVTLVDDEVRCTGTVAWSIATPAGPAIRYRAGVEFADPDTDALAAYCARYGAHPDLTFSGE